MGAKNSMIFFHYVNPAVGDKSSELLSFTMEMRYLQAWVSRWGRVQGCLCCTFLRMCDDAPFFWFNGLLLDVCGESPQKFATRVRVMMDKGKRIKMNNYLTSTSVLKSMSIFKEHSSLEILSFSFSNYSPTLKKYPTNRDCLTLFSKFSAPTIAFLAFWLAKKLRLWANSPSFTSYGK